MCARDAHVLRLSIGLVLLGALAGEALPAAAQTDYYNTDEGRPVQIEDAFPVEYHALELQLAPLRLERVRRGEYRWLLEPELGWGALPHLQLELAAPLAVEDAAADRDVGLAGIELAALYNLNTETRGLPAFALAAEALLPVGGLAPDDPYLGVKGIMTRTFNWARFHLNGAYRFGTEPERGSQASKVARWLAGVAVDHALPLQATLFTVTLIVQQPLPEHADIAWTAEAGVRRQLTPTLGLDAGVGKRFAGDERPWSLTFGARTCFYF